MRRAALTIPVLLLLLVACVTTSQGPVQDYWIARQDFNVVHKSWNDLVEEDNARIAVGMEPVYSQEVRDRAHAYIEEAHQIMLVTDTLTFDPSAQHQVAGAAAELAALTLRMLIFTSGG